MNPKEGVAISGKKPVVRNVSTVISLILFLVLVAQGASVLHSTILRFEQLTGPEAIAKFGVVTVDTSIEGHKAQVVALACLEIGMNALSLAGMILLWKFFNQMAETNRPFIQGQGRVLKWVMVLLLLSRLLNICGDLWSIRLAGIPLLRNGVVEAVVVALVPSLTYPLVFYCLAVIFDYGMKLQVESDETL